MNYEEFKRRESLTLYKPGDVFWVCDVRPNLMKLGEYYRKLEPTQVVFTKNDKEEFVFYKVKKNGGASKSKVSICGGSDVLEPFKIFEKREQCLGEYNALLKTAFVNMNKAFDQVYLNCKKMGRELLDEMQNLKKNSDIIVIPKPDTIQTENKIEESELDHQEKEISDKTMLKLEELFKENPEKTEKVEKNEKKEGIFNVKRSIKGKSSTKTVK